MTIQYENFTGGHPANMDKARSDLNLWRAANPAVKLIGIETRERDAYPGPDVFKNLRVWFEG